MTYIKMKPGSGFRSVNQALEGLFGDLEKSLQYATNNVIGSNAAPVNINETNDAFHLELAAPGRDKSRFGIQVDNDQLTLSYTAEENDEKPEFKKVRREFTNGNFKRTFQLEKQVNTEKIQAKYEDGLLKVYLPKMEKEAELSQNITIE